MSKSITEPLIRDHSQIRSIAGELRAFTERFDIPGMRSTGQRMLDIVKPHVLKEESVLYLIGMKFLKADNKKLPELFREHQELEGRLYRLAQLLLSARITNIEDQARQLVFVVLESINHHLQDEESVVFPALERFIDPETKELILQRYSQMERSDFDDLDRMPLVLPDMTASSAEPTSFGQSTIG